MPVGFNQKSGQENHIGIQPSSQLGIVIGFDGTVVRKSASHKEKKNHTFIAMAGH